MPLVAVADIEDVGKAVVFPLQSEHLVGVYGSSRARRPDDEHDPDAVDIDILKEGRSLPRLKDVEVLVVEVVRLADDRCEA